MTSAKFNFYTSSYPETRGLDLHRVLNTVTTIPAQERVVRIDGYPVYLHEWRTSTTLFMASLVKLRMHAVPGKGSTRGDVSDLDLEDEEGVAEEVSFLYHRGTQVIALQSSKMISERMFCRYFGKFAGSSLALQPVMDLQTLADLEEAKKIRRVVVKLAPWQGATSIDGLGDTATDVVALQQQMQNAQLEINISLGQGAEGARASWREGAAFRA